MAGKLHQAALKPFFRAALRTDGTLEIQVYKDIGESIWSYDGGITTEMIAQQIEAAGNFSKILLRINSPGGDVFDGVAIYNLIRAQKKPVQVCIDGIAASAASIIAMAGDDIVMGPNAMMMIHNAWSSCQGYASDMRKRADALDKISGAIAQTYVSRTKKTLDAVTLLMEAETWMTAQDCLAEGFATAIVAEADDARETNALAMARNFRALAGMKTLPENLKNAETPACECACDNCQAGDCANCTNVDCDDANCMDCPMQADAENASNLSLYEARAKMLRLTA
jgi:ATP-dependent protease ClpP protease subunit